MGKQTGSTRSSSSSSPKGMPTGFNPWGKTGADVKEINSYSALRSALKATKEEGAKLREGSEVMGKFLGLSDSLEKRTEIFSVLGDHASKEEIAAANSVTARFVRTSGLTKGDFVVANGYVWQVSTKNNSTSVSLERTGYEETKRGIRRYTEKIKVSERDRTEGGVRLTQLSGSGAIRLWTASEEKYFKLKNKKF